jgi:hypothetical protein
MADAALTILRQRPSDYSGHLVTDEQVLRESGVADLSEYLLGGSESELSPSWFLPEG